MKQMKHKARILLVLALALVLACAFSSLAFAEGESAAAPRPYGGGAVEWAERTFSGLEPRVAWNQPVFTDHGTFIIGISVSAGHLAVSPGRAWRAFSGKSPGAAMPGQNAVPHPVGEGRGLHAAAPDDRLQPHRKGPLQDFLAGEGMTTWIPWRARALLAGIYLPGPTPGARFARPLPPDLAR